MLFMFVYDKKIRTRLFALGLLFCLHASVKEKYKLSGSCVYSSYDREGRVVQLMLI